jgi:hypothetical protein
MTAKDQRMLDQSLRAAVRISDWLADVTGRIDPRLYDQVGELIHALEQEGAQDR